MTLFKPGYFPVVPGFTPLRARYGNKIADDDSLELVFSALREHYGSITGVS